MISRSGCEAPPRSRSCFSLACTLSSSPATSLSAQFPDEEAEDSASAGFRRRRYVQYHRALPPGAGGGECPGAGASAPAGLKAPGPRYTRIVFTRDSIEWGHAATLGDLLTQVPGVYLWRGGYIGRPEPVNFQARGASSVEYFLDGMPYVAAGIDSVSVDPVLISLVFLDRIEVERWPGLLRVHLFTRRNDHLAARSRIAIARGDNSFARYDAALERRFTSGLGFTLAGDYLSSPTQAVVGSSYSNTQLWGPGELSPHLVGGSAVSADPHRAQPASVRDQRRRSAGHHRSWLQSQAQRRTAPAIDAQRAERVGPRADIIYSHTSWDGDGLDQQIDQVGGLLSYRTSRLSLGGSAFHRTRWTPLDARINAGLNPVGPFSASAESVHLKHFGGRASDYATLAAGLEPLRGLALTGSARLGKMVAAPSILTDPEQDVHDLQAALGWGRGRLGFQVSYARTSAFSPLGYADFPEFLKSVRHPVRNGLRRRSGLRPCNGSPWKAGTAIP